MDEVGRIAAIDPKGKKGKNPISPLVPSSSFQSAVGGECARGIFSRVALVFDARGSGSSKRAWSTQARTLPAV